MSCMTLCVVRGGKVETHKEFNNSWRWAPFVWDALCDKYGLKPGHPFATWKDLWKQHKTGAIVLDSSEDLVLQSTYDGVIVRWQHIAALAEAMRVFNDRFNGDLGPVADELRRLAVDESVDGVCFWGTSVTANPWADYDLSGDKHWFLEVLPSTPGDDPITRKAKATFPATIHVVMMQGQAGPKTPVIAFEHESAADSYVQRRNSEPGPVGQIYTSEPVLLDKLPPATTRGLV